MRYSIASLHPRDDTGAYSDLGLAMLGFDEGLEPAEDLELFELVVAQKDQTAVYEEKRVFAMLEEAELKLELGL